MDNIPIMLSIIFGIVGAVGSYYLISILRDACSLPSVRMGIAEENSDDQAVTNSVILTKEAKREIEIFDDGDNFEGSAYNDDRLIDAVLSKLREYQDFKVRVFFNIGDPELKFIQKLRGCPQVEIYVREDDKRPDDRHYRIIDGGIKGNISKHPFGDGRRVYQNFDCVAKSKSDTERAGRNVLRVLRQPMKDFKILGPI